MDAESPRSFDLERHLRGQLLQRCCCGMAAAQTFLWLRSWAALVVYKPFLRNLHLSKRRRSVSFRQSKKVALLDDWCFDETVLALPTQLLWYEGKYSGPLLYQGTAPIFVTVKEKDLGPIIVQGQVASAQGIPSEHTMLMRWLKMYSFTNPLPRSCGPICRMRQLLCQAASALRPLRKLRDVARLTDALLLNLANA